MSEKLFCKSGGCTAKLGAGLLSHVLERLPKAPYDENLIVGYNSHDDGAVYKVAEGCAVIHTLDFFPPVVEDPYTFGQIAATNALSDIYAMGGEVKTALNIVCFPEDGDLNILGEIMRGGADKVTEAGGSIAGGHSIADKDIKYGLSVTGVVDPKKIYKNNGGAVGDVLILTKKLGVGLVCSASRVGEASEAALSQAIKSMTTLNKYACDILKRHKVNACTDVTGFGFLGHLREMTENRLSCEVYLDKVPYIKEALDYANEYLFTGAAQKNRNYCKGHVRFENVSFGMEEILFDPQTSGGLLAAVACDEAEEIVNEMKEAGLPAEAVGRLIDKTDYEIIVKG